MVQQAPIKYGVGKQNVKDKQLEKRTSGSASDAMRMVGHDPYSHLLAARFPCCGISALYSRPH